VATYLIRRLLYAIPTVLGVVLITFALFFVVNTPEHMARRTLGERATDAKIEEWIQSHGYDQPLWYNSKAEGLDRVTSTLFYRKCARTLFFDFGRSDATGRDIATEIGRRMGPSLTIAIPSFVLGIMVNITLALILAFCRGTYLDRSGTIMCVLLMSISALFYIIGGQFLFAKWLSLFPISGFDWEGSTLRFVILPLLIGVIGGIGGGVRYYRTVMLEEVNKDYVRTAWAKGLSGRVVLFRHVLKNAMIPILTNLVMAIPFLFMGSLLMESFFSIPGLGSLTLDAIGAQDYAVIRSMTFLGSVLYIIGLLLTDVSYTLVDPRITLGLGNSDSMYGRPSVRDIVKILACFLGVMVVAGILYYVLSALARIECRIPILTNLMVVVIIVCAVLLILKARSMQLWRNAWSHVRRNRIAMISLVFVSAYLSIAMLDSIAWSDVQTSTGPVPITTVTAPRSVLERACGVISPGAERTYSAPLSDRLYMKQTVQRNVDGRIVTERVHPKLKYPRRHLFGTDKTGRDVFTNTLRSARTGLIVAGLTTLIAVPFAILFGVLAGFFGGAVDDVIQYIYTTLSSIPWVLLVVCFMMIFGSGLVQLCAVLGITGWIGLCRVLRGQTLKLREQEYVQAAVALGVSKLRIIARHILPNLMYLILINIVLRFSGLVLAEAVLSYIGVGVGPDVASWGSMINEARSELGREPLVWWNLAAAFVAMFFLVLPVNLFGDALRDALDPRLRIRGEDD
jgi:peptide/nickel transport system permease protein